MSTVGPPNKNPYLLMINDKYNSKYNIIQIKHNTNLTGQGCTLQGAAGETAPPRRENLTNFIM
jgi:hypothetical protein